MPFSAIHFPAYSVLKWWILMLKSENNGCFSRGVGPDGTTLLLASIGKFFRCYLYSLFM